MPFHDLNLVYTADHAAISNTLLFAKQLDYDTVALSIIVTGKLDSKPPAIPVSAITKTHGIKILTRLTLTISDTTQNHRMSTLANYYNIIALRPTDEKTLQHCCSSLECDLISLDLSQRLPCFLKFKMVASALQRGIRFEICYSPGIVNGSDARKQLISGAMQLIRATRGRGIVLSSEAKSALGLRAPWDIINLAQVWGLSQQRAKEGLCEEAGKVVRRAKIKRTSYQGVVDIISGGATLPASQTDQQSRPAQEANIAQGSQKPDVEPSGTDLYITVQSNGTKRKASQSSLNTAQPAESADGRPISKNEMKRRAKKARSEQRSISGQHGLADAGSLPLQHESLIQKSLN